MTDEAIALRDWVANQGLDPNLILRNGCNYNAERNEFTFQELIPGPDGKLTGLDKQLHIEQRTINPTSPPPLELPVPAP